MSGTGAVEKLRASIVPLRDRAWSCGRLSTGHLSPWLSLDLASSHATIDRGDAPLPVKTDRWGNPSQLQHEKDGIA